MQVDLRPVIGRWRRCRHSRPLRRATSVVGIGLPLAGCAPSSGAPAIPFLGAFFPYWLLSALAGVLIAIAVRVVFVRIGLDDALPARLVVYLAVAVIAGLFVSDLVFGR